MTSCSSDAEDSGADTTDNVVAVVALREDVKAVKSWLEANSLSGKSIERLNHAINPKSQPTTPDDSYLILTTLRTSAPPGAPLRHTPPAELAPLLTPHTLVSAVRRTPPPAAASPLHAFLRTYLTSHPPATSTPHHLLSTAPKRSTIYPPLLLLPSDAFASSSWQAYVAVHPTLLPSLAASLNVTHIARNAPIAASSSLRSPSGLEFLHRASSSSSSNNNNSNDDGDRALWVGTTQHGLRQTWAPEHTMFSRGNIREKARVLSFAGVRGADVADLYAGIGYFVFPYMAAGARRVWCWEVNAWSVEALRRGCGENGWSVAVVRSGEEWVEDGATQVVVFAESNEFAAGRLRGGKKMAHVNLGLLPSSRGGWETAVEIVENGGCMHVHENVGEKEVEEKRDQFVGELGRIEAARGGGGGMRCEHVERVKTFAPGVLHCVFDVRVGGDDGLAEQ